jgi:hypothetical protein
MVRQDQKKKLCGNFASLRLCVRFCFLGSGLSGFVKLAAQVGFAVLINYANFSSKYVGF